MKTSSQKNLLPLLLALTVLPFSFVKSQSTWVNGNGSWSDAAKWSPASLPATNGTADIIFNANNTGTSTIDSVWASGGAVNSITLNGSGASLSVGANGVPINFSVNTLHANFATGAPVTTVHGNNTNSMTIGTLSGTGSLAFDFRGNVEITGSSSGFTGDLVLSKGVNTSSEFKLSGGASSMGSSSGSLSVVGSTGRVGVSSQTAGVTYQKSSLGIGTTAPALFNQNNNNALAFFSLGSVASTFRFTDGITETAPSVYNIVLVANANVVVELQNTSGTYSGFLVAAAGGAGASYKFSNASGTQTFAHIGTASSGGLNTTNNAFGIERASGGATSGTTVLTGPNTYTGTTSITGGTLKADGAGGAAITNRAATATIGSNVVTMSDTSGLVVGQLLILGSSVSGVNTAHVITSINPGTSVTLSGNSTVNASAISTNAYGALGVGAVSLTGGVLSGTGTIRAGAANGITVNGGTINAGDVGSVGTLVIDSGGSSASNILNVQANAVGSFTFDLNSGLQADRLSFLNLGASDVAFGNITNTAITFNDLTAGSLAAGNYTIMTGLTAGTFTGLTFGQTDLLLGQEITGGLTIDSAFSSAYVGSKLWLNDTTGDMVLVIPEPSTWLLLTGGLSCVLFFRRRRR